MKRKTTLITMLICTSTLLFAQEEPLHIDASGNVRIGTGKSLSKLDVNADLNVNRLAHFIVNIDPNTGNYPTTGAGLYIGWNRSGGRGETNFINNMGKGGPGGFSFENINGQASTTVMTVSGSGNVGIGTGSPNTSAVLDLSSTAQGFLPPRLTFEQRNAIQAPAEGLVIWCRTCGAAGELEVFNGAKWTNMMGGNAAFLKIGEPYQGGILAYILQPGDPGYDPETYHGFIMASTDQTPGNNTAQLLPSATWGENNPFSKKKQCRIPLSGPGKENTPELNISESEAAKLCADLNAGNYRDWYLPSMEEWGKLIANQLIVAKAGLSGSYWGSTVIAQPRTTGFIITITLGAYTVTFPGKTFAMQSVVEKHKVRAIRSF